MNVYDLINKPIGIFDSGVGGLTVVKEIHCLLPNESTVYLGDTARVPYGIRSVETINRYSLQNTRFLMGMGIKLLIIACNTASAVSIDLIRSIVDVPVLGVIEPGAKAAVRNTKNSRIGVIGTEATIKSGAYRRAIHRLKSDTNVFEQSCPLFVPLVEEGWLSGQITEMIVERYLMGLKLSRIDTLVLGCTHYPLLKSVIGKVMGPEMVLIDSAIEKAKTVRKLLGEMGMLKPDHEGTFRKFYVTDTPGRFLTTGHKFLIEPIEDITQIDLSSLEMAV